MNNSYSWDLELLLEGKTLEHWLSEYEGMQSLLLSKYTKDLFTSKEQLKEFHKLERDFGILSGRIRTYISNKQNTEQFEHKWFALEQELIHKSIPFSQALADFSDRAIKARKEITSFLEDEDFREFKRYYETIFRYKKHKLHPRLAKFELTFAPLSSAYYELFNILSEKEFLLEGVRDSNEQEITVSTYPEYLKHMKSEDSLLRKNLFLAYSNWVYKKRESFYRLLYYQFLSLNIESKNVAFKGGYFESCLYSDELQKSFIFSLYSNLKKLKPLVAKYRKIRKQIIMKNYNLDCYNDWDAYLDIKIDKEAEKYSIEEAKEIVLDALGLLGPDYIDAVKQMFENRWIDWLPRKGKNSGAYYSGGGYRLPGKYVLLNYNEYYDDVLTVAHEVGHAVHDIQIDKTDTHYYSPTIFTAEIPSILNEIILNYYFLEKFKKEGNKLKMLSIYDHLLSTFVSTAVVQVVYSEWEYSLNSKIVANEVIDYDWAAEEYAKLISLYLGREVKKDPEHHSWRSLYKIFTIPHFYSGDFYLYKYSVGLITSLLVSERLLNPSEKEKQLDSFFKFLKAGNSIPNLECLNLLSISFKDKESWSKIKDVFKSWLDEYTLLAKEIYEIKDV
ncbi:oligoendopeptidase F [Candidatus Mycoplasma haematolamae str. Purdue]|uniref:Oligoendopeptidase F n=1 Tax=Mycoplasma haematolamae (strain Purdue) TaxID=1212765 RepID=I7BAX2_MYCHA|nr:M3 family metallopeptidase [Candidatus Mycoplasma haematolamae]AFO52435.1 oligoendopeptidase F [Candidatus Mycoplasma haematolamae str. Purdue]